MARGEERDTFNERMRQATERGETLTLIDGPPSEQLEHCSKALGRHRLHSVPNRAPRPCSYAGCSRVAVNGRRSERGS